MKSKSLLIPVAILVGALLVAGAVYKVFYHTQTTSPSEDPSAMRPVDASDHILGNPAAAIVFVEYSDIDCPFCKNFQATMEHLIIDYGATGKIAWVYRHFPITAQDSNAVNEAEASECVASQRGNAGFFRFIDAINTAAPGTAQFNPTGYPAIIQSMGLDPDVFANCLSSHTYQKQIVADGQNAVAIGATGAPFTLLFVPGEKPIIIDGAFSYDQMKQIAAAAVARVK
jgi:protein-disulfide isomerase